MNSDTICQVVLVLIPVGLFFAVGIRGIRQDMRYRKRPKQLERRK